MPNLAADKSVLKKYVKNLGGKDYLQVSGRIYAAHDARQLVGLETELFETDTHYRYKATATVINSHLPDFEKLPDEMKFGTFSGWSQSKKTGGKSAEGTNPLEVCETSAVGRALGFAGFGDLENIASYEEIETAISRSAPDSKAPTAKQKEALMTAAKAAKLASTVEELDALAKEAHGKALPDLTADEVVAWTATLKQTPPF